MTEPVVEFQGKRFLFIGNHERTEGAIATPEAYENFEMSFAHLYGDGVIRRFGVQVGTREDLKWIEEDD